MGIDDLVRVWVQLHKHFEDELPGSGRIFFHTCDTANIHMTYQADLWRINNNNFLNGNQPNKNVTYQTPVILLALPTALSTLLTASLCSTHCPPPPPPPPLCLLPLSTLPTAPLYSVYCPSTLPTAPLYSAYCSSTHCPSLLYPSLLYPLPLSTLVLYLTPPLLYLLPLSTLVLYLTPTSALSIAPLYSSYLYMTPLCSTHCPSLL